jgi:hypothetical protein
MMTAEDRRYTKRIKIDLKVTRQSGFDDLPCSTENVSPTGIRIRKSKTALPATPVCNLELHLVPGSISTVIAGKRVWTSDEYEGFEFISPSFSQQMIIERLSGTL